MNVKGIYRNGRVELFERPEGVEQADVVVTFRMFRHRPRRRRQARGAA